MNKYSTFWQRFTAAIIDSIILWPLTLINGYIESSANRFMFIFGNLILTIVYSAYFIILHGMYGQTIGKKIMGIKVTDINEVSLIGNKRALIRELPWIITNISVFLYSSLILLMAHPSLEDAKDNYDRFIFVTSIGWLLVELITMLTNYKRRAMHDYLAKSIVINTDTNRC